MASAPQPQLPLFYNDLAPLNSRDHANLRSRQVDKAPWVSGHHAIPLTTDEFVLAHRDFPIIFSSGDQPVPLAVMGLNEGVNVFFNEEGTAISDFYVPAYIRRYPYLLARLDPNADTLSLCFDPTSDIVGEDIEGAALFDGDQPSAVTTELLQFCQNFEEAGARTQAFVEELVNADLLMDGELTIQRAETPDQPFLYRGFKMVNQDKLKDMRGDKLRTWNQNGILPLIYAHLFSLDLMRIIFGMQVSQGKGPVPSVGEASPQLAGSPA